jgi:hypothetical protein
MAGVRVHCFDNRIFDHLVETRLARIEKVFGPVGFGIKRTPTDIADTNLIEMAVGPADGRLQGQVQAVETDVERHLEPRAWRHQG